MEASGGVAAVTPQQRSETVIQALLNLQWSFILINPFWRGGGVK